MAGLYLLSYLLLYSGTSPIPHHQVQSSYLPCAWGGGGRGCGSFNQGPTRVVMLIGFWGWFIKRYALSALFIGKTTLGALGYHVRILTMPQLPWVAHSKATSKPSGWQFQSLSQPGSGVRQVSEWNSRWFQTQLSSHTSLQSFQLRLQTSESRDKSFPFYLKSWPRSPANRIKWLFSTAKIGDTFFM